ncbi:hypothetical protein C8F04DRAFT_1271043 [Mycena alexandri]|uniref:Uncharacterized protein n=1 Tax=Mycena alexandri TaxID=1745969 RepID=A0AAD6SBU7_9AGAR|nr:hypothetical protein C8F04DRAFT_1271043 [Mycena alexandri]
MGIRARRDAAQLVRRMSPLAQRPEFDCKFPSLRDLPNIAIATTPAIMLLGSPTREEQLLIVPLDGLLCNSINGFWFNEHGYF